MGHRPGGPGGPGRPRWPARRGAGRRARRDRRGPEPGVGGLEPGRVDGVEPAGALGTSVTSPASRSTFRCCETAGCEIGPAPGAPTRPPRPAARRRRGSPGSGGASGRRARRRSRVTHPRRCRREPRCRRRRSAPPPRAPRPGSSPSPIGGVGPARRRPAHERRRRRATAVKVGRRLGVDGRAGLEVEAQPDQGEVPADADGAGTELLPELGVDGRLVERARASVPSAVGGERDLEPRHHRSRTPTSRRTTSGCGAALDHAAGVALELVAARRR